MEALSNLNPSEVLNPFLKNHGPNTALANLIFAGSNRRDLNHRELLRFVTTIHGAGCVYDKDLYVPLFRVTPTSITQV